MQQCSLPVPKDELEESIIGSFKFRLPLLDMLDLRPISAMLQNKSLFFVVILTKNYDGGVI